MTSVSAQQYSSFGRIADSSAAPDKRFHEKLWIIDGGTDQAMAVTGGLNIGNNYFRANPADPDNTWWVSLGWTSTSS